MVRKKKTVGLRKYGTKSNYTEEDLAEALDKIRSYKMSQRDAEKYYKIPRSTIKYKLKGQHTKIVGKPIALTESEENTFISHIIVLADMGIPLGMRDVRLIVKKYLDDAGKTITSFKNNMPGWDWGKNFLDRHPNIKQRIANNISRKRAQITKEMIEKFFDHLKTELEDVPPENLYNFDETGFHDNPKKSKLLFRRSCRSPEVIKNATKSSFTVMFCGNAKGEFLPPFIVYKAKQKWSKWLDGAPAGTRMAVSKCGWIDTETFDEWFQFQVLPILKCKPGKKVIIGDNLSSHISVETLQLCEVNNIKFICLIPNSTHLLQPLDVAYFSSLKNIWRSVLNDWRNTSRGKITGKLPKAVFATLLKNTLDLGAETAGQNIIAGFKATGLFPCDATVPIKKLPDYGKPIDEVRESVGETFKTHIDDLRNNDLVVKQIYKFRIPVVAGKSVSVEEIKKYIEQRQDSNKKKKTTTRKRETPTGSKNIQPKKKKSRHQIDDLQHSTKIKNNVNADRDTDHFNDQHEHNENSQNYRNIIFPQNTNDQEKVVEKHMMIINELNNECNVETYEVYDGKLGVKDEDRFCVFNYEGTIFPGKIIQGNHPRYRVSVMQKAGEGWIWPKNVQISSINYVNIIGILNNSNIQKKKGYYVIEDDCLTMQWGD